MPNILWATPRSKFSLTPSCKGRWQWETILKVGGFPSLRKKLNVPFKKIRGLKAIIQNTLRHGLENSYIEKALPYSVRPAIPSTDSWDSLQDVGAEASWDFIFSLQYSHMQSTPWCLLFLYALPKCDNTAARRKAWVGQPMAQSMCKAIV